MRGDNARVLIVGAGIAGLATARTRHDWGASVEVVDRMQLRPSSIAASRSRTARPSLGLLGAQRRTGEP